MNALVIGLVLGALIALAGAVVGAFLALRAVGFESAMEGK